MDIEDAFIHRCDLERLHELLDELLDEDWESLMTCFVYENDYIKRLRQKYGMTGSAVRWKKEQLLKVLKKRFLISSDKACSTSVSKQVATCAK
ncbi:MAG: hypothetical protein MR308_10075 [Lachnospiraceae bacterium]|nr:hypothetical protein [Lachnospiraceae bacterium]